MMNFYVSHHTVKTVVHLNSDNASVQQIDWLISAIDWLFGSRGRKPVSVPLQNPPVDF